MFNSICICGDAHRIGRLIGFSEDDEDYYYVVRFTGGDVMRWSQVGWIIPLRKYLPKRAYEFLEHVNNLNGNPPADEFLIERI